MARLTTSIQRKWRKAATGGKEEPMPRTTCVFKAYVDAQGKWRWRMVARNGRITADSGEGYSCKRSLARAIQTFMRAVGNAKILWP